MGFFDLFAARKKPASSTPPISHTQPAPPPPATTTAPQATPVSPLALRMQQARAFLEKRDLASAQPIYEEILAQAGDRADVLVSLSADLGATGHVEAIIELIAPRYDAQRHGPATGINLLQAYLLTRNPGPAQHLLDILFSLNRPELAERLHGFSNALAELIEGQRRGEIPPPGAAEYAPDGRTAQPAQAAKAISLASISKPIWAYGVESVTGLLPPAKEGRFRRVGFAQLALVEPETKGLEGSESVYTRLCRGLPLWLAETFYFSPHYQPIAAIGMLGKEKLVRFPTEWTAENVRQLVDTCSDGLDYVFTGVLRLKGEARELSLKVWEVKKLKERKQFTITWNGEAADEALRQLHEQVRLFMEWQTYPGGPAQPSGSSPSSWCDSLSQSLALFLADKQVIPAQEAAQRADWGTVLASRAAQSEGDAILWYTAVDRARRVGLVDQLPAAVEPHRGTMAEACRTTLAQ